MNKLLPMHAGKYNNFQNKTQKRQRVRVEKKSLPPFLLSSQSSSIIHHNIFRQHHPGTIVSLSFSHKYFNFKLATVSLAKAIFQEIERIES
jgi:hypothetical protein